MNITVLSGNLVETPEVQYSQNNNAYCRFTIANNDNKEKPLFMDCVVFNKQAENLAKYQQKGNKVLVQGRLTKDDYKHKEYDIKIYKTSINAYSVEFLEFNEKEENSTPQEFQPYR